MVSFIAIALSTSILVSVLVVAQQGRHYIKLFKSFLGSPWAFLRDFPPSPLDSEKAPPKTYTELCAIKFSGKMFAVLSDLQIVNGLAIIIAGYSQLNHTTYYHEGLIVSYFTLALLSHTAFYDTTDELSEDSEEKMIEQRDWRAFTRTFMIFCSMVLGWCYSIITTRDQIWNWDSSVSGFCFRYHDNTSLGGEIFFWVGSMIFIIYLFIRLTPFNKPFHDQCFKWSDQLRTIEHRDSSSWNGAWKSSIPPYLNNIIPWSVFRILFRYFTWLLRRYLSFWVGSTGIHLTDLLSYFGLTAWSLFDVLDIKLSNAVLVRPVNGENVWGFGQVLAMIMLVALLLPMSEIISGISKKISCR